MLWLNTKTLLVLGARLISVLTYITVVSWCRRSNSTNNASCTSWQNDRGEQWISWRKLQNYSLERTATRNIIIFGQTGAGKSSIINMLAGSGVAEVSDSASGCTSSNKRYSIPREDNNYTFWDTPGLNEVLSRRRQQSRVWAPIRLSVAYSI